MIIYNSADISTFEKKWGNNEPKLSFSIKKGFSFALKIVHY